MSAAGHATWFVALTETTRSQLERGVCTSLLVALSGGRHLISDFDIHTTLLVLDRGGLLGVFHSVFTDRNDVQASDPLYMRRISRESAIRRNDRCIYADSRPGPLVAAKVFGWTGCLIARTATIANRAHVGCGGVWYDSRFSSLRRALRHYIFGDTTKK
mgnify:CR=1 FL=1